MITVYPEKNGERVIGFNGKAFSEVLELIKSLPKYARSYNPESRLWTVQASHFDEFIRKAEQVDSIKFKNERRKSKFHRKDLLAEIGLTQNAPRELIEAARKVYAKLYHPDLGGDEEVLKRINAIIDLLLT
jgi:hypothetical protein